jgi:hypothetical protein
MASIARYDLKRELSIYLSRSQSCIEGARSAILRVVITKSLPASSLILAVASVAGGRFAGGLKVKRHDWVVSPRTRTPLASGCRLCKRTARLLNHRLCELISSFVAVDAHVATRERQREVGRLSTMTPKVLSKRNFELL